MKDLIKISKAYIDINKTLEIIIKSLLFSAYYLLSFIFFKKWLKEKTNFSELDDLHINEFQLKMIGSNHTRRRNIGFIFITKVISKLLFWKSFSNSSLISILKKNPYAQYKAKYVGGNIQKLDFSDQIIFCGDSHVEFFSRVNLVNSLGKKLTPISIWLGPRTLLGFASDKKIKTWFFEILKRIKKNNNKKLYIIFSIGSIDIRTTIGYLLATKSIDSEKQFFNIIERSYQSFYETILTKIKDKNNIKVAFLSIPPVSPLKGINIKKCSLKKAIEYQKNSPFSIFGSPKDRARWTKLLNLRLEKISKENGWYFINNDDAYETIQIKNNYIIDKNFSFDSTHISQPNFYAKTLKNIIIFFENNT